MSPTQGNSVSPPSHARQFTYGPSRSLNYVAPFVYFFLAIFAGSLMLGLGANVRLSIVVITTAILIGLMLVVLTGRSLPTENERLPLVLLPDRLMLPLYGRRPWKTLEIPLSQIRKIEIDFVQEAHPEFLYPDAKREVGFHLILALGHISIPKDWMPTEGDYNWLRDTLVKAVSRPLLQHGIGI
jgi:hypothetical protein